MSAVPFYPEERRFVQELRRHFEPVVYQCGIGIKGLDWDAVRGLPRRIRFFTRHVTDTGNLQAASAFRILPPRWALRKPNARWLRRQIAAITGPDRADWTFWMRFPSPELVDAVVGMGFKRVVYEHIDRYAAHPDLEDGAKSTASERGQTGSDRTGDRQ